MDSKRKKAMAGTVLTALGTTTAAGTVQTSASSYSDWYWFPYNFFKPDNYDTDFAHKYLTEGKRPDTTKGWLKLAVASLGTATATAVVIATGVAAAPVLLIGGIAFGLTVILSAIGKISYGEPSLEQTRKGFHLANTENNKLKKESKEKDEEIKNLKKMIETLSFYKAPALKLLNTTKEKVADLEPKLAQINCKLRELKEKINQTINCDKKRYIEKEYESLNKNYEGYNEKLSKISQTLSEKTLSNINAPNSQNLLNNSRISETFLEVTTLESNCNKEIEKINKILED